MLKHCMVSTGQAIRSGEAEERTDGSLSHSNGRALIGIGGVRYRAHFENESKYHNVASLPLRSCRRAQHISRERLSR